MEQTLNRESLGSWSRLSTDRAWVRGADSQPTEPGFVEQTLNRHIMGSNALCCCFEAGINDHLAIDSVGNVSE